MGEGEVSSEHLGITLQCHKVDVGTKCRMARMASTAAWGRGEWGAMVQSVSLLPRDSQDGAFYRAVLSVHNQVSEASHAGLYFHSTCFRTGTRPTS